MELAPRREQSIPDRLILCPMLAFHPASTTPGTHEEALGTEFSITHRLFVFLQISEFSFRLFTNLEVLRKIGLGLQ